MLVFAGVFVFGACAPKSYETAEDEFGGITITLSEDNVIRLVKIPAGTFKMGSAEGAGEEDELPVREVTLTKDFYMGRCEINQQEWESVMGNNPSMFKGDKLPVETVSWEDCMEFCRILSERTGLDVSLPTEAQWEYACRAGSDTRWFFGDSEEQFGRYANANTEEKTYEGTRFEPNSYGLFDMYGNVMEWCLDYYGGAYPENDATDPKGCAAGDARVSRGGGWGMSADECRSAYRNACGEKEKSDGIGFRIVVNQK